jgi:hypothetical protein
MKVEQDPNLSPAAAQAAASYQQRRERGRAARRRRSLQASTSESRESAREQTRLLEKEVPHSSSVTSLTFLVETPSTYISMSAKQSAFSFLW